MNDDLFFIPEIARALRQPDPKKALRRAFGRIQAAGRQPRYRRAHAQFLHFMDAVMRSRGPLSTEQAWEQLLELARRPSLSEAFLLRGEHILATWPLREAGRLQTVGGIEPGRYGLRLDSGRLVWEERLTAGDLLLAKALPGQPIPVAAADGRAVRRPTRRFSVLGGAITVSVYAGIESGLLEIES